MATSSNPPVVELTDALIAPLSRPLSLSIEAGELLWITGDAGSGKSTLLRTLAGLHPLKTGQLKFSGDSCHTASDRRRFREKIGILLDRTVIVEAATVRENLRLDPKVRRFPMEWVDRFRLRNRLAVRVSELSAQERRRVELTRALARRASLLLLDDPMPAVSGLEEEFWMGLRSKLSTGTAVVIASTSAYLDWGGRELSLSGLRTS